MATTFTIESANKILPLVKHITKDIVDTWESVYKARIEIDINFTSKSLPLSQPIKEELNHLIDKMNGYIKEIEALGCFVEEFKRGIVNFPCTYDERKIFLCWKLGEDKVENWHEIDETYDDKHSTIDDFYFLDNLLDM